MRARPLGAVALCLGAVLAGIGVGVPGAGAVTTDQSYLTPATGRLVVRGHGYGHGHGMSQYGAEGAAKQGLGYRKIVEFYYPGTRWSTTRGNVRVLISADTTPDLVVSPTAGLTLKDLGNGTTYPLPDIAGVTRWRVSVGTGNTNVVSYRTTTWHHWSPGGNPSLVGEGQFRADGPLTLWTPSGAYRYRGALRAASPAAGSSDRDTVNVLSMDAYLKGVVPREMPASWDPEAVKAQAVAARTYATWSRAQHPTRYYQICDTTSCQVYGGLDSEDARSNAAVAATAGQMLTYAGKPAFTQFSSSSGGWTVDGGLPYLSAKPDPYDAFSGNPVHDWSATLDAGVLERSYPAIGTLRSIDVVSRDGHGDWRGRVWSMVLHGTKADRTISGETFRALFGLRSTWFTIGSPTATTSPTSTTTTVAAPPTATIALSGPILRAYRHEGGAASRLGRPTTGVQRIWHGHRAKFQHGIIWSHRGTGTVPVIGRPIVRRYRDAGGVKSRLGWPTRSNRKTRTGERVDFQHGFIAFDATSRRTRVHVS